MLQQALVIQAAVINIRTFLYVYLSSICLAIPVHAGEYVDCPGRPQKKSELDQPIVYEGLKWE
jgi:hypothetical protein